MTEDSSIYASAVGAYVPYWLLCCAEIDAGAKLAYAWLAQLVDEDNAAFVCLEGMATGLGVTESQAANFLLQLREYGFIRARGNYKGKDHFQCVLCEPEEVRLNLSSRRAKSSGRRDKPSTHHGARSGVAPRVNGSAVPERIASDQPLSKYDLETCLSYVKQCREEGERIGSVYALAQYLHKTGAQDAMISIVLGLEETEESGGAAEQDGLPFGAEVQDETGIDQ